VRSSPAINPSEGAVYFGASSLFSSLISNFYARNLDDGSLNWTFTPPDPNFTGDTDIESSPTLDANGNIYIGSDDHFLYALDKDNGNELWRFDTGNNVESKPSVSDSRQTVYVEAESQFLFAVNISDGSQRWALDIDPGNVTFDDTELESSPAVGVDGTVNDGMIYVGSKDGHLYAASHAERIAGSGFPVVGTEWRYPSTGSIGVVRSSPAIDRTNGSIYFGSDDGNVYAVNPDGTEKWIFATAGPGAVRSSPAVAADGTIYIGSDDGHLYAINPSDGSEIWRFPSVASGSSVGEIRSTPAIDPSNGAIYVGSNDGNVYTINPDGTEKWNFSPNLSSPQPLISSPAIGPGGIVYIGSDDGFLYAINQFQEPVNFKDENRLLGKLLTSAELGPSPPLDVADTDEWLNGDAFNLKPWAVRLEVDRADAGGGNFSYNLSLWIRQCADIDCTNIVGTVFEDTRIDYDVAFDGSSGLPKLPMTQDFELNEIAPPFNANAPNPIFERFLFGFTTAVDAAQSQNLTISKLQLSFVRPGDATIDNDLAWNTELGL
jgi:glucose dehydrogenase